MGEIQGFTEYSCDVQTCEHHDFAQPDTDKANSYGERRRYDDNGVLRELLLCSEHIETYSNLVSTCEAAYVAFEKDGTYTLATKAEVDALQAQVDKLTADYEALRKNRDSWVTKYNALNAEFEEYKRTHPDTDGGEE